jgi:hypothetical protein
MTKADGTPCKAIAGKSGYCSVHSGFKPQLQRKIDLEGGFDQIKKFLARVGMDLKRGNINPNTANALVNVANSLLKLEEMIEVKRALDYMRERDRYPHREIADNPDLAYIED